MKEVGCVLRSRCGDMNVTSDLVNFSQDSCFICGVADETRMN
jgi:hypothetical protein